MGATDLSNLPSAVQLRSVQRVVTHQDYNPRTEANDIALIQLNSPVVFSDVVQPACLPQTTVAASAFSNCYISGWGTTMQNGEHGGRIHPVHPVGGGAAFDHIRSSSQAGQAGSEAEQGLTL